MINNLLPVGSVVLLKYETKKLMIIGILPIKQGETDVMYDYIGVMYPEGYINAEYSFLFNHEDIADIVFTGYSNVERKEFMAAVAASYNQETNKQEN